MLSPACIDNALVKVVIPAQADIQDPKNRFKDWIPVSTGMIKEGCCGILMQPPCISLYEVKDVLF